MKMYAGKFGKKIIHVAHTSPDVWTQLDIHYRRSYMQENPQPCRIHAWRQNDMKRQGYSVVRVDVTEIKK
jgi:hypothetical protein